MQDKKFRAFIAIDLPHELKQQIADLIKTLQQQIPAKKIIWSEPEKSHLTLKFLGNVSQQQCAAFLPDLTAIVSQQQKFILKFSRLDLFPSSKRPRVIALLPQSAGRLAALALNIENQLTSFGIAAESRVFKPHLTIARLKQPAEFKLPSVALPSFEFEVEQIALFRSHITQHGSQYEILRQLPLG